MKFGCFFVGQRPQLHEQYADESKVNPNPVRRTDVQVYEDILRGAELAEQLGFDSVWIAEHAFSEHSIISSPHSLLAAIAARTNRVTVGVACTIVPWHPPLRMAQDLATIDVISRGRLIIGVGRGYQKREFDAYGVDISESRDRFLEGMDIAVKAWTQERLAYDGKYHSIPEVMIIPKPVQQPHPPILMAVTHSPESVEIAVSNRWGLFTVGSTFFPAAPEVEDGLIGLYYTKMVEAGVPPEDITIAAARNLYVAESDEEAMEVMSPRLQWAADMSTFVRSPVAALAGSSGLRGYEHYVRDPFIDPELSARRGEEGVGAIGSPERVTATIRDLENKHVTHFLGYLDAGGMSYEEIEGPLTLFAEKVMPKFK
jgi:alkanesulfonate monooxygenase SsuD/methylene tetrahydromethanopterin reductase-like flavin-dependent oxidoreductase (luciferase family)